MNLGALRDEVLANTRRSDKLLKMVKSLNLAQNECAQVHDFFSLEASFELELASTEGRVLLPEELARVVDVKITNEAGSLLWHFPLKPKSEVLRSYPNVPITTVGLPTLGYLDGRELVILPFSNAMHTVTVSGWRKIVDMVEDTDEPSIAGVDQALIAWATADIFRSIQQHQDAQQWDTQYVKSLRLAVESDRRRPAVDIVSQPFNARPYDDLTTPTHLDPFAQSDL